MSYRATALILASAVFLASPAAAAAQEPPATSHIRGRVLSPQGSPVSDVRVCARPLNGLRGRLPCESSDAAGNFSIPVAPGETYFMTAGKEADGYADTASPFYRVPFASLPEVIVPEGQAPPEVTFHLAYPAGRLALRVADAETGLPVERARVRLCRLETPRYCSSFIPAVVAGLHRLLVPPAPVSVEVSAEGYEAWHAGEPVRLTGGAEGELGVALAKAGGRPGAAALPAPAQTSPAEGTVFERFPRATRLAWAPVPGAASYTVEVEFFNVCGGVPSCPETSPHQLNGDPPQSGIEATSYEFNFIGAQPGRWRVWAVDAGGRAGAKSPWSTFVYKR